MNTINHAQELPAFTKGKGLVVLLGSLTAFDPLSLDMYLPAFEDMHKSLNTSIANIELSVTTFFVGMALGQLIYGPLADRYGRKKPLLIGMIIYFLATIGCAYAPNIETFIAFRLIQALGGCAGMVITRAIIRDIFDKEKVAAFLSNMALIMGLAPIFAPMIGSVINQYAGWRGIFWVLAAANLVCLFAIAKLLPETNRRRKEMLEFSSSLTAYAGLLRNRQFVGYLLPDTAIRAGMFAYIAGSPFVFIELFHVPQEKYGLIFGMNGLGLMAASQLNRLCLKRWGADKVLNWSVRFAALAAAVVMLAGWQSSSLVLILAPLFIFLASLNFIGPNALAGALSNQGHQAGTASALYGCLQWSMAAFSSLLVSHFHNNSALPMTGVIFLCGLISLVSFQILVVAPRKAA